MPRKLYEYRGTIRSTEPTGPRGSASMAIILHDPGNYIKAPAKVDAFGALAEYIKELLLTDCAEKYMPASYGYDENLILARITYKDNTGRIVKVVAHDEKAKSGLTFFGPKDYINTPTPSPLSQAEIQRFCRWNCVA